jgi:tetratricopeptide (TPR) repeat protein
MRKRALSWVVLALLTATGSWATQPSAREPALLVVPEPDLEALETAVAEQLLRFRQLTMGRLEDADLPLRRQGSEYGELGTVYHAYDLTASAMACYFNAEHLAPEDFRWPYYLGHLRRQTGDLEEAENAFLRALELQPDDVTTLIHLGELRMGLNRPQQAEEALQNALALEPTSAAAHAQLGRLELSRKRYRAAIQHLEFALRQVPEATLLYYSLALAYRGLGEVETARQMAARRGNVGVRPPDPLLDALADIQVGERVYLLRGRTAFGAGHYEEAAAAFRQAIEARPDSARARVNLGTSLAALGSSEDAAAEFERALELEPGNITAHFNLAALKIGEGADLEASRHLEVVVSRSPRDLEAHVELAGTLERLGLQEEALMHYVAALELQPAHPRARVEYASALVDAGLFQEALLILEEGHRHAPYDGQVAHGLARMLAGSPALQQRDGERALDLAQRVYAARPTPGHAATVALALAELERCDDAALWQRRAVDWASAEEADSLVEALRLDLLSYQQGSPCRP